MKVIVETMNGKYSRTLHAYFTHKNRQRISEDEIMQFYMAVDYLIAEAFLRGYHEK